jgi:hypothetical protein
MLDLEDLRRGTAGKKKKGVAARKHRPPPPGVPLSQEPVMGLLEVV